jgi:shikimate dehydrogenase
MIKKPKGLNVTIPFKKDIIKYLDNKNIHAQKIGAVNCVTVGKKIKGINTDWVGYLNSIKQEKINKNKNILILGFGGASQAIYYGFFFKGYKNVSVFNRSKKAINIGGTNKYTKDYSLINSYLIKSDLIINTTPINPLNKKQTNLIKKTTIISDIVYKPKETAF